MINSLLAQYCVEIFVVKVITNPTQRDGDRQRQRDRGTQKRERQR